MKSACYLGSLAVLALLVSIPSFAKDKDRDSGNFTIADTVAVCSTVLQPGDYKAQWSGPADNVKIDITQHGKTVATTNGSIKEMSQPAQYSAVVTKDRSDNTKAIDQIQFNHRTEELVISGE
jgi:hypothetical protein